MKKQKQPTETPADKTKLKFHEYCSLFPPMGDDAYKALIDSIKRNGFNKRNPITLYQGKILDGAHRQTACKKLKMTPEYEEYKGDDPLGFVIEKNLARRHLTTSQNAALAAEFVDIIRENEKAAKLQEKESSKSEKGAKKVKEAKGTKTKRAAAALNVSERYVAGASKLKKEDPAEFEEVKKGKKGLSEAIKSSEEKKSAKDKQGDAYAKALDVIADTCGAFKAGTTLKAKDVIKFSELEKDKMVQIKPLIEAGWTLVAAIGYKAATLSLAHTIRNGVDRAIAQGGKHTMDAVAYGKKFIVEFTEVV